MLVKELMTDKFPVLRTSATGLDALGLMDEYRVSHLPILNDQELLGIISDEDILNLNHFEEAIGNHKLSLPHIVISEDRHIYDAARLISEHKISLLPVVDHKNGYLGVIPLSALVHYFSRICGAMNPGGVLILEINERDYSLSEISQIVESNEASILSLFIESVPDSTALELTLKLNKIDLSSVIQTFNRYNYTIKASFSESDIDDLLRDRYDSLMTFLNT